MNRVASFNFYGSLADAVLNRSANKKTVPPATLFPSHHDNSNSKRRTYDDHKVSYKPVQNDEPQKKRLRRGADEDPPAREVRKIDFDELPRHAEKKKAAVKTFDAEPKRVDRNKTKRAKSDKKKKGNETDSQAEESGMEDDAGGSSQDRYESDFIDDDGREEIEQRKKQALKKGQIDESEEEAYVTKSMHSASSSEDEDDPYTSLDLKLASDQPSDGFKYRPDTKEYVLPDWFALPASVYERLFEHQKLGVKWLYGLYRSK